MHTIKYILDNHFDNVDNYFYLFSGLRAFPNVVAYNMRCRQFESAVDLLSVCLRKKPNIHACHLPRNTFLQRIIYSLYNLLKTSNTLIINVRSTKAFKLALNSKAAVDHLVRTSALEVAKEGVRVNAVNPGVIVTDIHRRGGMSDDK